MRGECWMPWMGLTGRFKWWAPAGDCVVAWECRLRRCQG